LTQDAPRRAWRPCGGAGPLRARPRPAAWPGAWLACAAAAFLACDSGASKSSGGFSNEPDVFVAGFEISANNVRTATLWKNGAKTLLSMGASRAEANSVFVAGANVYVAGFEEAEPGSQVATYWVNGVTRYLGTGHKHNAANSVFVWGDKVYFAGTDGNSATVWVNGSATYLSDLASEATSVYVSDSVVYVAGWEEDAPGRRYAMLWVNGVPQRLSNGGPDDAATSVVVAGYTVYVTGHEERNKMNAAMLWKDGAPIVVGQGGMNSKAKCVKVSGNRVYVVFDENGRTKISTNGSSKFISDRSSYIHSVFASGPTVYASPCCGRTAPARRWATAGATPRPLRSSSHSGTSMRRGTKRMHTAST